MELIIYVVNLSIIFSEATKYCSRAYAVKYMVIDWNIYCAWAITLYQICATLSLAFYMYVSVCAFDHYHMGFDHPELRAKEIDMFQDKLHGKEG